MIAGQTRQAPASAGVSSGHFARTYIKLHAKTGAGHHRGSKASHWERFGTRWVLGVSRTGIMLMEFQGVRGHPRAAPCEATARAVVSRLRDLPQDRGSTRTDVPDSCRVHSSTSHIRGLRHASKLLISKRSLSAAYDPQSSNQPARGTGKPGHNRRTSRPPGARHPDDPRSPPSRARSNDPPEGKANRETNRPRHHDTPGTHNLKTDGPGAPGTVIDRHRADLGSAADPGAGDGEFVAAPAVEGDAVGLVQGAGVPSPTRKVIAASQRCEMQQGGCLWSQSLQ